MAGINEARINQIVKWITVGTQVYPVIVATVKELRAIFTVEAGYDPAVFDEIDRICADRIVLSDAEAAAHGHPRPPIGG